MAAATPATHLSPWANDRWWLLAGGFTYHTVVHHLVISCEVGNGIPPIFQLRMLRLKMHDLPRGTERKEWRGGYLTLPSKLMLCLWQCAVSSSFGPTCSRRSSRICTFTVLVTEEEPELCRTLRPPLLRPQQLASTPRLGFPCSSERHRASSAVASALPNSMAAKCPFLSGLRKEGTQQQ